MKKHILGAVALSATLITTTTPTFAAAVTGTATVNVSWNTQSTATLQLFTNYAAAGTEGAGNPTIATAANGGGGTCTATGGGAETAGSAVAATGAGAAAATAATLKYGQITPDTTNTTDCNYENAINALVTTTSSNWSLTEAVAGTPAGFNFCAFANNATGKFPFAAGKLAAQQTAFAAGAPAEPTVGTCTSGATNGASLAAALTLITNGTAVNASNYGEDLELQVPANAPSANSTATITYTLTAN